MWRPEEDWAHQRSVYFEQKQTLNRWQKTRQKDYEAGADAMLDALWKMAKESPTGTFTLDTHIITIHQVTDETILVQQDLAERINDE